jgi:predicted transcriptional regulator
MQKAKIIKELIEKTGLNLKAFAEKAGMPYTTLYSILERGVGKASVDNVIKICKALGITIEDLENLAAGKQDYLKPTTIAAHFEGEQFTEEELEEINNYIKFVISKRKK